MRQSVCTRKLFQMIIITNIISTSEKCLWIFKWKERLLMPQQFSYQCCAFYFYVNISILKQFPHNAIIFLDFLPTIHTHTSNTLFLIKWTGVGWVHNESVRRYNNTENVKWRCINWWKHIKQIQRKMRTTATA